MKYVKYFLGFIKVIEFRGDKLWWLFGEDRRGYCYYWGF